jgi:hypothetical protein
MWMWRQERSKECSKKDAKFKTLDLSPCGFLAGAFYLLQTFFGRIIGD